MFGVELLSNRANGFRLLREMYPTDVRNGLYLLQKRA